MPCVSVHQRLKAYSLLSGVRIPSSRRLKESHKVLKHLMKQEELLKVELVEARRTNERTDGLNVDYLKNVQKAFLMKVYGA